MSEEKQICKSFEIKRDNQKNFNFLAVGCWGVYCEEGKKTIIKKKKKGDEIIIKKEEIIRGQKTVAEIIKHLSSSYNVDTIYLTGDNIYHKSVDENTKEEDIDADYNQYDIEKQIKEGFRDCFINPNLKNYFVIAGNHDAEDCKILERELNEQSWDFKNLFYNTFFPMEEYDIDVMCIDTNILELIGNKELCTLGNSENLKSKQMDCVQSRITTIEQSGKPTWKIMVGHIPYKALGHKSDKCIVDNSDLFRGLIDIYKPHIYISADEHNQQFLTEIVGDTNVALVVAGSGGTAQDDVKTCNPNNITQITVKNKTINIPYSYTAFGIPLFQVTKDIIVIDYYNKENNNIKSNFNVEVFYNHSIITIPV